MPVGIGISAWKETSETVFNNFASTADKFGAASGAYSETPYRTLADVSLIRTELIGKLGPVVGIWNSSQNVLVGDF